MLWLFSRDWLTTFFYHSLQVYQNYMVLYEIYKMKILTMKCNFTACCSHYFTKCCAISVISVMICMVQFIFTCSLCSFCCFNGRQKGSVEGHQLLEGIVVPEKEEVHIFVHLYLLSLCSSQKMIHACTAFLLYIAHFWMYLFIRAL